jgi:cobalt-zinc-cadmium resistance protein CzcA
MINRIISFSIRNKFIVGLLVVAIAGLGIYSMSTVKLGSVPDITNNQVQVITVSENLSTEDIEQFVTYPLELAMGNLPGVVEIRSISRFGLSVVTIVFEDDMGTYLPRQLVQEKLSTVKKEIPEKFGSPFMGPIATGLGEIYQYTISQKEDADTSYTPQQLRTIQDWLIKRQLTLIEGVVDVNSFGGFLKQYEVAINPDKLNAHNVTISQLFSALKENNVNTGGSYIAKNKMANFIRGEGLAKSIEDIEKIVVQNESGIPVTVADVSDSVYFGNQVRYGAFTRDGHESVGGIVMMLKGANPNTAIEAVKKRMKTVEKSLPPGLTIKAFLDRSELIARTTNTVSQNLIEGALIVIFALVLLLGSFRGGLITATTIPLSLLFAFILMKQFNVWANLMSLGAIDFGIIVDGAVIIIEGTVYEIQKRLKSGKSITRKDADELAYQSGSTMMRSAFFGQLIILIVFTPILFLTGVEGKMFKPMAFTFGFAMIGAIILCLTYVPMMSALFMKPMKNQNHWFAKFERKLETLSNHIIGFFHKAYEPVIKLALRFKAAIIILSLAVLGITTFTFSRMGGEFIPQLDEGDLAMQVLIRPGSTVDESVDLSIKIENILLENFPNEIKTAVSRIGVADIPTDPMPMDIADMAIILEKDHDKWTAAESKEELIEKIRYKLNEELAGFKLVFSQPVELRFNELLTGVREDIAIKLYGEDLTVLSDKAEEIGQLIADIEGVGDVNTERISGLPQITVDFNRDKIAQYGLNIARLNEYVSTAFAGGKAGVIFEGEKRFNLVLRLSKDQRSSIEDVRQLLIDLPNGQQVPMEEVANIEYKPGPMQISRDNTYRRTYVGINTRGSDVETVVTNIQEKLNAELDLPPGYYINYGGEFENLERAKGRLSIVVPIALFLIFILLYFALKSFKQSLMIYIAIPLAAIGGVYALYLRGMPFSISAGVGFIVLFGVAVLNGLVLINRFNELKEEGVNDIRERIMLGTKERIRPIMLTATTDIFGFLPMAFSTSAGAEVQRPLATVVIGGMLTATLLTLIVIPVLYSILEKRKTMNKSTNALTVLALLFMSQFSFGQNQTELQPISVQQAVDKAVNNYPALKVAALEVEQQEKLKKTAYDFGNTQLYRQLEEAGNGIEGVRTNFAIQQQQIDVFAIPAKLKVQRKQIATARAKQDLTEIQIKRDVQSDWARVVAARKQLTVFSQLDSAFAKLMNAAEIQRETEEISELRLLATQNRRHQIALQKEQSYRDYTIALQKMNSWFVEDTLYTASIDELDDVASPIVDVNDSVNTHSELDILQRQIEVADAQLGQAKSQFLPKLQGLYGVQEINGQDGFQIYQFGVQIPLFFFSELGTTQSAGLQKQIAQENYNAQKLKFYARYSQTKENYVKWLNSWKYYKTKALPLAQKQRRGALIAFEQGAIDYVAFLQNINDAIQLEIDAWSAYEQMLINKFSLEYYTNNK